MLRDAICRTCRLCWVWLRNFRWGKWVCHWLMCQRASIVTNTLLVESTSGSWSRTLLTIQHPILTQVRQIRLLTKMWSWRGGGGVTDNAGPRRCSFLDIGAARDRKLLKFRWEGNLFQFRVLPLLLSSAPRVSTWVLKAHHGVYGSLVLKNVIYLDDFCLASQEKLSRLRTVIAKTTGPMVRG